jgi:hypothetical protein
LTQSERQKREKLAADLLMQNISISPIRGSALVDISYTSGSSALSAQISNAWTEQFIVQSMDRRFASTADARKFLEERLADLRARLETSERDLVNYAEVKGIVALGKSKSSDGRTEVERTLVSSDLEALNSALATATADRIAAESRATMAQIAIHSTMLLLGNFARSAPKLLLIMPRCSSSSNPATQLLRRCQNSCVRWTGVSRGKKAVCCQRDRPNIVPRFSARMNYAAKSVISRIR